MSRRNVGNNCYSYLCYI